ncbi:MAG: hypothetical protein QNJ77_12075 [Acidimicrobiia bacterium]|nr:hypothetical protein [Acidimicrobiia bacterium]
MAGLEPRGFKWVIAGRLAISERIGGYGFQHRRVRREEEIIWLAEQGINTVLSLMPGNQNQAAYEGATLRFFHFPIEDDLDPDEVDEVFQVLDDALAQPGASVLVHRELIGDLLVGLMGGYLVHSGLVTDPVIATSVIQEISGRPLGPEGRQLIPTAT